MTRQPQPSGAKRHRDLRGARLVAALRAYAAEVRPLRGIEDPTALECLVKQLLDSVRRVTFVKRLAELRHQPEVADPTSSRFDPLKAAVYRASQGDANDAIWLAFLAVHFGKHGEDGWTLARLVYGRIGEDGLWDWRSVSADPASFRRWLGAQNAMLRRYRFSNHRAYESLGAETASGTGACVESFVAWVGSEGSFDGLVRSAHRLVGQNPVEVFDALYKSMDAVQRFGRLGKFDFLTTVGKLGLSPISPGSAYIWDGATGPYRGVRLLLTGETT